LTNNDVENTAQFDSTVRLFQKWNNQADFVAIVSITAYFCIKPRPSIDAARDIGQPLKALLRQVMRRVHAAHAVVAKQA
jgi:hypothetical protein